MSSRATTAALVNPARMRASDLPVHDEVAAPFYLSRFDVPERDFAAEDDDEVEEEACQCPHCKGERGEMEDEGDDDDDDSANWIDDDFEEGDKEIMAVMVDRNLSRYLSPHHKEGINFMYRCIMGHGKFDGLGCILAGDSAVDRALQCIALFSALLRQRFLTRVIVLGTVSAVAAWEADIRFLLRGECPCLAMGGSVSAGAAGGALARKQAAGIKKFLETAECQVLILSYDCFCRHMDIFKARKDRACCDLLVCDEAQSLLRPSIDGILMSDVVLGVGCRRQIMLSERPVSADDQLEEYMYLAVAANPDMIDVLPPPHVVVRQVQLGRKKRATAAEAEESSRVMMKIKGIADRFILSRRGGGTTLSRDGAAAAGAAAAAAGVVVRAAAPDTGAGGDKKKNGKKNKKKSGKAAPPAAAAAAATAAAEKAVVPAAAVVTAACAVAAAPAGPPAAAAAAAAVAKKAPRTAAPVVAQIAPSTAAPAAAAEAKPRAVPAAAAGGSAVEAPALRALASYVRKVLVEDTPTHINIIKRFFRVRVDEELVDSIHDGDCKETVRQLAFLCGLGDEDAADAARKPAAAVAVKPVVPAAAAQSPLLRRLEEAISADDVPTLGRLLEAMRGAPGYGEGRKRAKNHIKVVRAKAREEKPAAAGNAAGCSGEPLVVTEAAAAKPVAAVSPPEPPEPPGTVAAVPQPLPPPAAVLRVAQHHDNGERVDEMNCGGGPNGHLPLVRPGLNCTEFYVPIHSGLAGWVIGAKGERVRNISRRSGAFVRVMPGMHQLSLPQQIRITGRPEEVAEAFDMVEADLRRAPKLSDAKHLGALQPASAAAAVGARATVAEGAAVPAVVNGVGKKRAAADAAAAAGAASGRGAIAAAAGAAAAAKERKEYARGAADGNESTGSGGGGKNGGKDAAKDDHPGLTKAASGGHSGGGGGGGGHDVRGFLERLGLEAYHADFINNRWTYERIVSHPDEAAFAAMGLRKGHLVKIRGAITAERQQLKTEAAAAAAAVAPTAAAAAGGGGSVFDASVIATAAASMPDNECIVCLCEERDALVMPCRHAVICSECADLLVDGLCPLCRQPYTDIIKGIHF